MIPRPIHTLAIALTLAVLVGACSTGGGGSSSGAVPSGAVPSGATACPTAEPAALPAGETRTVTIATDLGPMTLKIEADLSPIAAGNFVALADCGYYDGVVFHRTATLEDGTPFVIQGGDPDGTGRGGPGYSITDEPVTATYDRGVVAMARTEAPNSVGSQFFIVLDDRDRDVLASANTYQIIGTITSGMDVVDAIYAASNGEEIPTQPVAMTDVTVANP